MNKFFWLQWLAAATVFSAPTISSLAPVHGPVGTVVTITGSGFTGAPHVALVTAQANEIYTISSDTIILYTVPPEAQLGAQPLQIFNGGANVEATFTVDAGSPPPPVTQPPAPAPRCMIDSTFGNFHTATSALGDTVALLWCDDQVGLDYWIVAGSLSPTLPTPACIASLPAPSWSFAFLTALWMACAATSPGLNADQDATASNLIMQFVPKLTVSAGAAQNLYTMNQDGTKGAQLIIGGFGMKVAPGTPCMGKRLRGAGARYHQMGGKITTNGQLIPPNTFAICSISYPPAGGFILP
jgi:hypothetical protein